MDNKKSMSCHFVSHEGGMHFVVSWMREKEDVGMYYPP